MLYKLRVSDNLGYVWFQLFRIPRRVWAQYEVGTNGVGMV